MKGLELCHCFYEEYGKKMISEVAPGFENRIAVGVAGNGSECFGFDDKISRDHDFFAGFSLWLTKEDEAKIGFRLIRAYSQLPDEFMGVKLEAKSAFGTGKFGVKTIEEFLRSTIGQSNPPEIWQEWFYLPEYALAQAVNGEIFRDDLGEMTAVREKIRSGMPRDVLLKKLAACLALMAQSGQYNYERCLAHGERAAAQLSLNEFVNHTLHAAFLLEGKYLPYYKWSFRALNLLDDFACISHPLESLITTPNTAEHARTKAETVEQLCKKIIFELKVRELSASESDYLENHALAVTSQIVTPQIRSLHLMDYGE